LSPTLISEITADLDAEAIAWRSRPLEPIWPIPTVICTPSSEFYL
jgi:hypothetical protein